MFLANFLVMLDSQSGLHVLLDIIMYLMGVLFNCLSVTSLVCLLLLFKRK